MLQEFQQVSKRNFHCPCDNNRFRHHSFIIRENEISHMLKSNPLLKGRNSRTFVRGFLGVKDMVI
jgi:hypothetical protein